MYDVDASRFEEDVVKKLCIRRIYDMILSQMENKKKRIVAKDILIGKVIDSATTWRSLSP